MRFTYRGLTGGALLALGVLLGLAAPAQARWLRAESPRFIVYSNGSEQDLKTFTSQLDDFDALLQMMLGVGHEAQPAKIEVYLLTDREAVSEVWPDRANADKTYSIGGFYNTTPEAMQDFVRRDIKGDAGERNHVLFHEYVHHFIAAYLPGAYPTWLNEGLAEYLGSAEFKQDKVWLGQTLSERGPMLNSIQYWTPIQEVICARGYPDKVFWFYAESWLATHYMMHDVATAKKLGVYVDAFRAGEDCKTALPRIMGMDFKTFQKTLVDYHSHMFVQVVPKPNTSSSAVTVTVLPPSADQLLLARALLLQHPPNGAAATLERVKSAAARFPDDALALKTLARAEILAAEAPAGPEKKPANTRQEKPSDGAEAKPPPSPPPVPDTPEIHAKRLAQLDEAKTTLDKVLARDPKDVEALNLQGERLMAAGRITPERKAEFYAQARPIFSRAADADPNCFTTFYYYGQTYAELPGALSDNTLNALTLAHNLAPQVDDISIAAAKALMRQGRWDDAIFVLEPIAYSPHLRKDKDAVQSMLTEARGHLKPTSDAQKPPAARP
jgi:tetratricopeptide (TPR) repeat protein